MSTHSTRRLIGALAALATLTLTATACGSDASDTGTGDSGPKDVTAALEKGGKVTVWAWEPTLKKVA
ncbi:sugar ABC transporter substrate-binding protein, partial [Streptomyces hydrogenans]